MIVYLYFKDKTNIENCEKNVLFFLHFSVFLMKNVWGYPYLKTHKKNSIENMLHFFSNSECWHVYDAFGMLILDI
jgi:hypothetical protein